MLNGPGVGELFLDAGVPLRTPPREGRRRYIERNRTLKRWPLGFTETLGLLACWLFSRMRRAHLPRKFENLKDWSARVLTKSAFRHLLAPAMQGIYAGDPDRLSASLLLKRFLTQKRARITPRGTVFPPFGMGQLIFGLTDFLNLQGVELKLNTSGDFLLNEKIPGGDFVVIATSAPCASQLLAKSYPELSATLGRIQMLSLVTVQVFAAVDDSVLDGFGALFPRGGGMRSLGVICDHTLFPERSSGPSERWILGGALDPEIVSLSDEKIMDIVRQDRLRLGGKKPLQGWVITRKPQALPHYTTALEECLTQIRLPPGLLLAGNYLGAIGLTQIFQNCERLAEQTEKGLGANEA